MLSFSAFSLKIGADDYQVASTITYDDARRERTVSALGYIVNLPWAREHYFGELTSQVAAIESGERRSEPGRTYWRLKGLVVHGYFTSEQVSKDVLKVQITPGKFDGAAPMPPRSSQPPGGHHHA